jgi:hypothetical protein
MYQLYTVSLYYMYQLMITKMFIIALNCPVYICFSFLFVLLSNKNPLHIKDCLEAFVKLKVLVRKHM